MNECNCWRQGAGQGPFSPELKSKSGVQTLVENLKTRGSEPCRSTKLRQNMNQLELYLPERRIKGVFIRTLVKTKDRAGRHSHEINAFANTCTFPKRTIFSLVPKMGTACYQREEDYKSQISLAGSKEAREVKERRLVSGPELPEGASCNNYRTVVPRVIALSNSCSVHIVISLFHGIPQNLPQISLTQPHLHSRHMSEVNYKPIQTPENWKVK